MNQILRRGLLQGVSVLVRGLPGSDLAPGLAALGARVEAHLQAGEPARLDALVLDCSAWVPSDDSPGSLQDLLGQVWESVSAVAKQVFIPGGEGGRILFIAPPDRDRPTVPAAVAGLENLSRTLSVEWARYRITTCMLAPSPAIADVALTTLVGYLLSPAGAYFSGTRLDLGWLSG